MKSESSLTTIKYDLIIARSNTNVRIAKIILRKKGDLMVSFPNLLQQSAILAKVTQPTGLLVEDINLAHFGKVTMQNVKFMYHPDGEAHFSADSKVRTEIRKKTTPLEVKEGSIFEINVKGISAFPHSSQSKDSLSFTVNLLDHEDAVYFRCYRFKITPSERIQVLEAKAEDGLRWADGSIKRGFYILPPLGWPFDHHLLFLEVGKNEIQSDFDSYLLFYGAHDPLKKTTAERSALFLLTPCDEVDSLKKSIGTIDLFS